MTHNTTECRTTTGVTVGLIDSIITINHLLIDRDLQTDEVVEALKDLKADPDFNDLLVVLKNLD